MVPPSLPGIKDDEFLWAYRWMFMTQNVIPDTGLMTVKFSSKLHSMVRICWVSKLSQVYCLDIFSPGDQSDWGKSRTNIN